MKLNRTLFYFLLALTVAGVVLVVFSENAIVLNQLSISLLAGSFVSLIMTLANYYHERETYFFNLYDKLDELLNVLRDEYIRLKLAVDRTETQTRESVLRDFSIRRKMFIERKEKTRQKYKSFTYSYGRNAFTPLLPSKKVDVCFDDLYEFINRRCLSHFGLDMSGAYLALIVDNQYTEEENDELYGQYLQELIDARDIASASIRILANLVDNIWKKTHVFHNDLIDDKAHYIINFGPEIVKDAPPRDPIMERRASVECEE